MGTDIDGWEDGDREIYSKRMERKEDKGKDPGEIIIVQGDNIDVP